MTDFSALIAKIGKAYAEIAKLEHAAQQGDPDPFLTIQINSIRRMAEQLESEWQNQAHEEFQEVCFYRVVADRAKKYSVAPVFRSISTFQSLFSQVFDALVHEPKERARISLEVENQTDLKLAYTYPGSFGFALYADSDASLFEDKFRQTAAVVADIMKTEDEFHVRDIASIHGQAVVKRIYDWSRANFESDFGVDLKWHGIVSDPIKTYSSPALFGNLVDIIEGTVDKSVASLEVVGILLGMDTQTRRFRFHAQPSGDDFAGLTDRDFDLSKDWTLNHRYKAKIRATTESRYATLESKVSYELLSLEEYSRG
ncbi:MAG: hypothetical protein IE925_03830 [Rhodobacterales bacterium]|nr:hypothetical protein [Rhodobacterales bacterium]